jgi:hypothetical protein
MLNQKKKIEELGFLRGPGHTWPGGLFVLTVEVDHEYSVEIVYHPLRLRAEVTLIRRGGYRPGAEGVPSHRTLLMRWHMLGVPGLRRLVHSFRAAHDRD